MRHLTQPTTFNGGWLCKGCSLYWHDLKVRRFQKPHTKYEVGVNITIWNFRLVLAKNVWFEFGKTKSKLFISPNLKNRVSVKNNDRINVT